MEAKPKFEPKIFIQLVQTRQIEKKIKNFRFSTRNEVKNTV